MYTDPGTGITFGQYNIPEPYTTGGFTWGIALPPEAATTNYPDYIGMIVSLCLFCYLIPVLI